MEKAAEKSIRELLPEAVSSIGIPQAASDLRPAREYLHKRRPEESLAVMGVPPAYRHCRFLAFNSSPKTEKVMETLRYLADERKWVFIIGSKSGIGKTHLAISAFGRSWWISKKSEHYFRFYGMRDLGIRIDLAGIDLPDVLDEVYEHSCILLDELGREPVRSTDKIETIIDYYYQHNRQVIATSNLSIEEFQTRYDPSLIRRIGERGKLIIADWE